MAKEQQSGLESALESITKDFGAGAIQRIGDKVITKVPATSTGSIRLDRALGVGGLPRGRIIELYGQESSGKSTIALHTVANAQKDGGLCAYIDAEHSIDVEYAQALGVNTDSLWLSQPSSGEEGLEICSRLIKSGAYAVIVIDSVAALTPRAELEGEIGDAHMGLQARMMGQALRVITGAAAQAGTTVIFINQLREKIGIVFGNPNVTTGGKSLKFYASVRMEVSRTGSDKVGDETVSNKTKVKVVKNKVSVPFRTAEFDIVFGQGINREGEVLDDGVVAGVVKKSGAWYVYGEDLKCQGRQAACEFLRENPAIRIEIEGKLNV
jgi:recombination protein RecA